MGACSPQPDQEKEIGIDDINQNNRGVALMGRFDYQGALDLFEQLLSRQPNWHDLRVNYAIALKNRQQEGDAELALSELEKVLQVIPSHARANYNAGVLHLYLGQVEPAQRFFEKSLQADSKDSYSHYYMGQCQLRLGDLEGALTSYLKAIDLDPYLRSAYYSAAQVLRRLGRDEAASEQLLLFQRFESNPRARLAEFKYTRMGPKSLAMVDGESQASPQITIPTGALFSEPSPIAALSEFSDLSKQSEDLGNGQITTVDIDNNGKQDLFLLNAKGSPQVVLLADEQGKYESVDVLAWKDIDKVAAVAWGDIDNNGWADAFFCRNGANQLWMQRSAGDWYQGDLPESAGLNAKCVDTALVDADHDGDLDILIANRDAPDELLNNNRNGTFQSLVEQLNDPLAAQATKQLLTTDIDADGDVDLIFIRSNGNHSVLINDRLWKYTSDPQFEFLNGLSIVALAAADFDADGRIELISLDASGELNIWHLDEQLAWSASLVYQSDFARTENMDLSVQDVSGNGTPEILLLAPGSFEVLSVTPAAKSLENSDLDAQWRGSLLTSHQYNGGRPVPVVRTNRGPSLIGEKLLLDSKTGAARQSLMEWSPGEGRAEFVTLNFSGKHDDAETMRSNFSGIGTQVQLRVGSRWSIRDNHNSGSLVGYSLQPLAIGLGGAKKADFIAVNWSDGVYQTELDLQAGTRIKISEEQRQLGSCPVLFTWNGEKFEFVTDILGVAAMGFLVKPGTIMPPRPWERVPFPPGSLAGKEGRLVFKVTEPMEENSYLDALSLESYDVPEGWDLILDERMATGEPQVSGKALYYRTAISPSSAHNSSQQDVLDEISEHDGVAMHPGQIDRDYLGILEQVESVTLEFEQAIHGQPSDGQSSSSMPILVAESWVELPYSQTHFAVWQAGKEFDSVSLEARDNLGNWQSIYPSFGMPAGMPRVMSLPLEGLPKDTTAIRLSWNREIYWDRFRIVYAESPEQKVVVKTIKPIFAKVAKSGFYKRVNHAQRRPEYLYQVRTDFGDVRYPSGFYTDLGEMTELVESQDNALAIIGPGEEVHAEFIEPESPPAGFRRWYVLDTRGWAKDYDAYTFEGRTVAPLPSLALTIDEGVKDALHMKYNNRFQSGE